ncbi:TrbC/VirB2 family protein [Xenorhabdus bovienii]|uniref:TrbC/VirB2 family protein n=1 Tax=Xenorhabdus bovienii TaxID=40576 RepID=UPI0021579F17|nr:TrbC/VirB2 family protein [Xenorhabdus bovienii]
MGNVRLMNKDSIINFFMFAFAFVIFTNPALAAGGLGNLNKATDGLQEIADWLYIFVGVGAVLYMIWLVGMALFEQKQWTQVAIGLGHCAMAGGVVLGADWALGLFK